MSFPIGSDFVDLTWVGNTCKSLVIPITRVRFASEMAHTIENVQDVFDCWEQRKAEWLAEAELPLNAQLVRFFVHISRPCISFWVCHPSLPACAPMEMVPEKILKPYRNTPVACDSGGAWRSVEAGGLEYDALNAD